MKHLFLTLLVMTTTSLFSQNYGHKWSEKDKPDYWYINTSFDVNMAFGIKDNKDTADFDDRGLDFDLELGARDRHVGVYLFYGRFDPINYQNYGVGVDYYVDLLREFEMSLYNPFNGNRFKVLNGIELSVGVAYGVLIRDKNFTFNGNHVRAVSTFWIGENIGLTLRFQLTKAGDLPNKVFRKEGSAGFIYKFNRN